MLSSVLPRSLVIFGCLSALIDVAHAQTAADSQPPPSMVADAALQIAHASALPSATAVLARTTPRPHQSSQPSNDHVVLLISWAYAPQKIQFSETQTFTKYREDSGRLDLNYAQPASSGFGVDGRLALWHGLGLQLGYSDVRRTGSVSATAQIPNPLYFQHDRSVTASGTAFTWRESTIHLDAAYSHGLGPVRATVFAGVSLLSVKADLVERLTFTQVYPYASENVTVTSLPGENISKHATGPDVGVAIDWPIVSHLGIGALVRYSGARVTLARPALPVPLDNGAATGEQVVEATGGSSVQFDARAVQIGVGVRLFF